MMVYMKKLFVILAFVGLSLPTLGVAAEGQSGSLQAALVAPKVLAIDFKAVCDGGVAVFKLRNATDPWKARALVSIVSDQGEILFQRALRMTRSQSMSYRMKRESQVSTVRILVDYPGANRHARTFTNPCA